MSLWYLLLGVLQSCVFINVNVFKKFRVNHNYIYRQCQFPNVEKGGILHLSDPADQDNPTSPTIREVLISKHPPAQPAQPNCILKGKPENQHPIIFESLDASIVHSAALRVSGAAGPSGLDAHEWRHLCTSHR